MEMVILMNQVNKFKDFTGVQGPGAGLRGGHHGEGSVTQAWWAEGGQAL